MIRMLFCVFLLKSALNGLSTPTFVFVANPMPNPTPTFELDSNPKVMDFERGQGSYAKGVYKGHAP